MDNEFDKQASEILRENLEQGFEGQPEPTPKAKAHREFRNKFPQRYGPQFHFDEETGIWTAESGGKVIYRSDTGEAEDQETGHPSGYE